MRLAIPQVVLYRLKVGLPCTIITEYDAATAVYWPHDDPPPWSISAGMAPVRRPAAVLTALGGELGRLPDFDDPRDREIGETVTRVWRRMSWYEHDQLGQRTIAWIWPQVLSCPHPLP